MVDTGLNMAPFLLLFYVLVLCQPVTLTPGFCKRHLSNDVSIYT